MDDTKESSNSPLRSTYFFGRMGSGHCDLDSISLSPSSSEFSPYIYVPIRRPSFLTSNHQTEANNIDFSNYTKERNSRKNSLIQSPKRKLSNVSNQSHQSFDNLTQLMRENQYEIEGVFDDIDHVTHSLPATPLTTPHTSPPGSPKSSHKKISNEYQCSLPWYYSGFIAANSTADCTSLVCVGDKEQGKAEENFEKKSIEEHPTYLKNYQFPVTSTAFGQPKKYNFTNRDMNFFAPTSM